MNAAELKATIREIADFPKPGIGFKDITTLLQNPDALASSVRLIADRFRDSRIDTVCGIESRGFIFGMPVAMELGVGFVPVRKPGKLPAATVSESYDLEYGSATIEMHADAVSEGDRVLIVDDLLATGGTLEACVKLVERCGGTVAGIGIVIELPFLNGRKRVAGYDVMSLVTYDGE